MIVSIIPFIRKSRVRQASKRASKSLSKLSSKPPFKQTLAPLGRRGLGRVRNQPIALVMSCQLSEGLLARIYAAEVVASLLYASRVLAFTERFYATIKWSKTRDVSAFKVLLSVCVWRVKKTGHMRTKPCHALVNGGRSL